MTKQCDNCGEHVTNDYWRVFSIDGVLHNCRECSIHGERVKLSEMEFVE